MHRRTLSLVTLLLVLSALPMAASQFVQLPFDRVASEANLVVRGTIGDTWSAWDDAHEVIFTYATVRVQRYFGGSTGPETLVLREVGGTVDGYTQEAIGFPVIRSGENVVLMLTAWDGSSDYRIHAFNQGKYLVRNRGGVDVLIADPFQQGDERLGGHGHEVRSNALDEAPGLGIEEFAQMVNDARVAARDHGRNQQQ
ncbi:MAG: hypothetical protein ABI779_03525 [Acidobacteriota bacterium]